MIYHKSIGLRSLEIEDLPKLQKWRNSPEMRKYFREWRELNMFDQETWFKSICCGNNKYCMFGICASKDFTEAEAVHMGDLLGVCGLTSINWHIRCAEVSLYVGINDHYIDEKFAPDALEALCIYAFKKIGLNKIWVEVFEFDLLKTSLLSAFNFKFDGILRDNVFENGQFYNSKVFSLLLKEYKHN